MATMIDEKTYLNMLAELSLLRALAISIRRCVKADAGRAEFDPPEVSDLFDRYEQWEKEFGKEYR